MKKFLKVISGMLIGLGLSYGFVAMASGEGVVGTEVLVREKVVVSLSQYLDKHPDAEIAHKLALWLVPTKAEVDSLGSTLVTPILFSTNGGGETRTQTVCYKDSSNARCTIVGWEEIVQAPAATTTIANPVDRLAGNAGGVSSTISVSQKVGDTIYIDQAELELRGIVSSSIYAQVGTSTVQGGAFNLTQAQAPFGIIQRTLFTTSTNLAEMNPQYQNLVQATSTYSINPTAGGLGNWSGVKMTTSTFLTVSLYDQVIGAAGTVMCQNGGIGGYIAGACEQVTSTNRGFTVFFRYRYHLTRSL